MSWFFVCWEKESILRVIIFYTFIIRDSMPPVNNKSPEIYTDIDKNSIEYQRDFELEEKKIEEQVNKEIEIKATQQHIESWFHIDTFDSEVEQLQKKIEANQISKEEANKLYDEITKKYDKASTIEKVFHSTGMRDKVTDKRNIKNTLLWTWWAVAVGWVASKWKSLFGKKDKKETNNATESKDSKGNTVINVDAIPKKNWFQRNWGWLAWWAWVWVAWYAFRKELYKIPVVGTWLDKLFNPQKIDFNTAFSNFESDINRWDVEKKFGINPKISYEKIDEKKIKLKSYNKAIVIDIEKRIVEWMEDIVFPNYWELLHAANIINFSAAAFQWVCKTSKPFNITRAGGDIEVQLLDKWDEEVVSGAGIPIWKIAWGTAAVLTTVLGAVYGWWLPWWLVWAWIGAGAIGVGHMADTADSFSQYCPTLNDYINKEKFRARLNKIPNLVQWNQDSNSVTESDLKPDIQKIIKEIENTPIDDEDIEFTDHWTARWLDAVPVTDIPDTYDIKSWNQTIRITYKDNKVVIDSNEKLIFDVTEGIRVANLTNKLKSEYAGRGNSNSPFIYRSWRTTLNHAWLYIKTKEFNINWTDFNGYQILKEKSLKEKYPVLLWKIDTDYIPYLNNMKDENNKSLWT